MKVTIVYPEIEKWYHFQPVLRVMKNDVSKTHIKSGNSYTMDVSDHDTIWVSLGSLAKTQQFTISDDSEFEIQIGDQLKLNRIFYNSLFVLAIIIASFMKEWYEILAVIIVMVIVLLIIYIKLLKDDITLKEIGKNESNNHE